MTQSETTPATYTDADVQTATHAVMNWSCDLADRDPGESAWSDAEEDVRHVLDAAAPAITARAKVEALREAADVLFASSAADFGRIGPILTTKQSSADWLRARADEIEAGR